MEAKVGSRSRDCTSGVKAVKSLAKDRGSAGGSVEEVCPLLASRDWVCGVSRSCTRAGSGLTRSQLKFPPSSWNTLVASLATAADVSRSTLLTAFLACSKCCSASLATSMAHCTTSKSGSQGRFWAGGLFSLVVPGSRSPNGRVSKLRGIFKALSSALP